MLLSNVFTPQIANELNENQDDTLVDTVDSVKQLSCEMNIINGANGSAKFSIGDTHIYCSVYGPRPNQQRAGGSVFSDSGILECDVRIASYCKTSTSDSFSLSEEALSRQLKNAIEPSIRLWKYPKSLISIFAVVTSATGNELAALVCGSSLALADSAIEMEDLVTASTVGILNNKSSKSTSTSNSQVNSSDLFVLDPNRCDYHRFRSFIFVSYMTSLQTNTTFSVDGQLQHGEISTAYNLAMMECINRRDFIVAYIKSKILEDGEKSS